jgi:hypothetical protein
LNTQPISLFFFFIFTVSMVGVSSFRREIGRQATRKSKACYRAVTRRFYRPCVNVAARVNALGLGLVTRKIQGWYGGMQKAGLTFVSVGLSV